MKFRFELDIKKLPAPITHRHKLLLIGSCFTENIGEKLSRYKFNVLQNPHGILFNPVSVAAAITHYLDNKETKAGELFRYNEAWHSWDHHSRFSGITQEDSLALINASTKQAHQYVLDADYVLITLGSAWVYTLTEQALGGKKGSVVANNHKAPADWFRRRLLTPEEVLQVLDPMIHRLFHSNTKIKILFTISPVRHLREGAVENNRSKAVLLQAVHHLVDKFDRLYYFPAYELVIDDLRDYRFYAEDLVHPNYFATQYVWEKFVGACMDEKTKSLIDQLHAIHLAYQHRPFNAASEQHRQFLHSIRQKTLLLQQEHPYLDLQEEIAFFSAAKG